MIMILIFVLDIKCLFSINSLDVFDTVSQMRRQRMKMVQKAQQYFYIFKCLKDEIKTEEGDYYS